MSYFEGEVPGEGGNVQAAKKPEEWLAEVVEGRELKWATDGQEKDLRLVVEQLGVAMDDRVAALRLGQALLVRPELPTARTRPSVVGVRDLIARQSPRTAQSPDGTLWCQVAAVCAAAVATEGNHPVWGTVAWILRERDTPWVRDLLNVAMERGHARRRALDVGWSNVEFPVDVHEHPMDPDLVNDLHHPWPSWTLAQKFQKVTYDLNDLRDESVRPLIQRLNNMNLSLLEVVNKLGDQVDSLRRDLRGSVETNALWWGQSLYSLRRGQSYRELDPEELLVLMADDLLDAVQGQVSETLVAYYVETARRLVHNLDAERSWADHASRTSLGPAGCIALNAELRQLVADEATGLPFTYLASGGAPGRLEDAVAPERRAVSGRAWARQVFRERHLNRWLSR